MKELGNYTLSAKHALLMSKYECSFQRLAIFSERKLSSLCRLSVCRL